ncbi:hypothetical protein [Oleispirillum naphthae]|uniref:hypothetical protein n=1 Tax=Oleispirillum naphthae TaxID=2838853 RepID=UPI0030824BEE
MTTRRALFPGRPGVCSAAEGGGGRVVVPIATAERRAAAPSEHRADVLVAGANPLLNALAALAEVRAGRRVIVAPLADADDWPYDLGLQASFHRFVDAAAETLYALSPSRRLDFRHSPFPRADRALLFARLRERRRRILDADVMRLAAGSRLAWDGEDGGAVRLLLRPPAGFPAEPDPVSENAAMLAAAEADWGFDIPRAVFGGKSRASRRVLARMVVVTSAGAIAAAPEKGPRIKNLGSACGAHPDDAAREGSAFDDVLAAISPVALPEG